MAAEGANIVIADMNADGAEKAAREYGVHGYSVAANVTDEDSVKNMIDRWCRLPNFRKIHLNNLWSIDIRQIKTLCRFERV